MQPFVMWQWATRQPVSRPRVFLSSLNVDDATKIQFHKLCHKHGAKNIESPISAQFIL